MAVINQHEFQHFSENCINFTMNLHLWELGIKKQKKWGDCLTWSLWVWRPVSLWAEVHFGWLPAERPASSHAKCVCTGQEPLASNAVYSSSKWGLPIGRQDSWVLCIFWFRRLTSFIKDATWRAVRGVCSAGLTTTVFPQLRAGPIFQINITKGKFH